MYNKMTLGAKKALQDAQDYYNYSIYSNFRTQYMEKVNKYLDYRDGDEDSIDKELKADLTNIKAKLYQVNRIQPEVNNIVSLQILSRKSIDFKANSNFNKHNDLAKKLKNYFYIFQQQNDYQNQATEKFEDGVVSGIGGSEISFDKFNGKLTYRKFDLRELILDPDDYSPRFDSSNFIGRHYFIHAVEAKNKFSISGDYIDSIIDNIPQYGKEMDRYTYLSDDKNQTWISGKSIKIVEIYYKKNSECYKVLTRFDPDEDDDEEESVESYFFTFSKEAAEKYKVNGSKIEKVPCTKIYKTVFTQDILLEHGPIDAQVPNQKFFPIIPICFKRDRKGYPFGIVKNLMDISDSGNYLWSYYLHSLSQRTLVVKDGVNIDKEKAGTEIINQLRQKYGFISLNATSIEIITNEKSLQFIESAMRRVDINKQQVTQLYDDQKGKESHGKSGVAIQSLQKASREMQNPYGVIYDYMLWSEGQLFLDTLRGIENLNLRFYYLSNQEMHFANLDDQLAAIDFQIFQDVAPTFISSNQETSEKLMSVISSGAAPLVFSNQYFAERVAGLEQKEAAKAVQAFRDAVNPQPQPQPQQENDNTGENI